MSTTPTVIERGEGVANKGHAAQSSTCNACGAGASGVLALANIVSPAIFADSWRWMMTIDNSNFNQLTLPKSDVSKSKPISWPK